MSKIHPLERRRIAVEATQARFIGKPFVWGKYDCAKLAAFHARQLGVRVGISKAGQWSSALGAKRALRRLGVKDLATLLDRHFARIPAAAALAGDIVMMPGEEGYGSLAIVHGNSAVIGWHEETPGCAILRLTFVDTVAWRLL